MLHELEGTPLKKHGQLYQYGGTPYENLGTLCSNLGMLPMFAGTPYEGEEGIREESRGHRAVLRVPHPSRKPLCIREERLSQRKATLRALLGTPSMRLEMPDEDRMMPTVKPRTPRRHPPSLETSSSQGEVDALVGEVHEPVANLQPHAAT
jgi:hypothetical protein